MIRNVSPQAQQALAKAVCEEFSVNHRVILCHTPAMLEPIDDCTLGTFDQIDESLEASSNVFLILPRPGLIQNMIKRHSGKVMSIHAIFQINSNSGPIEACVDLLQKAKHWFPNICRVRKSIFLQKGLLGNFAATAYVVEVSMQPADRFLIQWKFEKKYQDELLIPKIALAEKDIQDIIDEQGSSLLLKSTGKNSCIDFDESKNGQWVTFPYGGTQQQEELHDLVAVLRKKVKNYPATSLQWKKAVRWNNDFKGFLSFGILFVGHLSRSDKTRVANFLTGCSIDFFFCRFNVIVLSLNGLDDNTLLRLAQYAEVPIPACPAQGGFQLSFQLSSAGTMSWTTVSVGRIGKCDFVPAQVRLELSESDAGVSDLRWIIECLEQQVRGTCFQKVQCTIENQETVACLQFLVPQAIEKQLPLRVDTVVRPICIDHPAVFSLPLSISRRPPEEQDKFDHWKETASKSSSFRKGRRNSLSHCPMLVDSICRFNLLRHGDLLSKGKRFAAMIEDEFLPFLFVDGTPDVEDLVDFCGEVFADNAFVGEKLVEVCNDNHSCHAMDLQNDTDVLHILEVLQDKQEPLKIGRFLHSKNQFFASTSETLLCHAFSACMIAIVVPKGSTIDQICGPRSSYDVIRRIVINNKPRLKSGTPKGNLHQVENGALVPKAAISQSEKSRPLSYVTGREPAGTAQPLAAISTTLQWTKENSQLGSQMPQPVKLASPKDSVDVPMVDAECQEGPCHMDCDTGGDKGDGMKLGELMVARLDKESPKLNPASKDVVTAQASPLKNSSHLIKKPITEDFLNEDNKLRNTSAARMPDRRASACPNTDDVPLTMLHGTCPPGKVVGTDSCCPKKAVCKTTRPGAKAMYGRSKQNGTQDIKNDVKRNSGQLLDAFRKARKERSDAQDAFPCNDSVAEQNQLNTVRIDLTSNDDDPIDDEVELNLSLRVYDAIEKWYPDIDRQTKREDAETAAIFLRYMNSTLCFLTVAFRMLAKAPWKPKMLSLHVRQAALAAIGNDWYVWTTLRHRIPFMRAELALAAVSYRGNLEPEMPDDPAQAIFSMIDCLPTGIGCEEMFSQGMCFCPFCGNQKVFAVPTFATAITWKSPEWNSAFETLKGAEAFPWRTNVSWHRADCDRDEVTVSVTKFGPWALLLFRPHDRTLYPPLQEMAIPLSDDSLLKKGLKIQGLMCTDIGGEHGRHFWFVEPTADGAAHVYDSLKGLQPLTLELSKTLHVVGLLVMSIDSDKPVLTNAKLCQAAGNVAVHQKRNKPIKVAARAKRRAPRKRRTQRESKKSHVTRKRNEGSSAVRRKTEKCDDIKRKQGNTPPKRGRAVTYLTAFRRQCVQDPEDPISDVEIMSRPNKHMRNTPEKKEPCQIKTSPAGKVKMAENKNACPDNCFERTDNQAEERSQKGNENNVDAQQEILGRAGKESPSVAKSNYQEEGKVKSCQQSKSSQIATKRHAQEKDQCCEPPSFPKGNYGVISLFDGVSSVVPALCRKLKRNPSVIVLAEIDPALRELVSFEFGYCRQETWQVAFSGCPSIYVKDVRRLLENGCLVLRQAHSIAPTAKWFMIGGSPCQDLTYAGPFHGLLGLTGPCSVLFFPFQRTIWTMQHLAGPDKVRYLAENAGSMDPIHFAAFCQLLKLDPKDPKEFLWDAFAYGAPIQRGRNFFRGRTDAEGVDLTAEYFPKGWGPLMDCAEKAVPLAPLLRTRSVEAFGIYRSSWTLYQPKALVWHYDFWEGRSNFCTMLNYVRGKLPNTRWENIIPPPFQEAWRAFLEELARPKPSADKLDGHVQQLVPLFACATYEVPFRVVTPGEALKLSGLETHWKRTSIHDAENLPDNRIRDMCGNSFHPELVCSALGETSILEKCSKDLGSSITSKLRISVFL